MKDKAKGNDGAGHSHKKSGRRKARMAPASRGETLVKGVVMGFIISGVTQACRSITGALVRHPVTLFSTGMMTGYLTYKYRQEIIIIGGKTAVESKNFILRQREDLCDLLAEIKEESKRSHDGKR